MERIIRNCDICGKNISDTTNENYAETMIGNIIYQHCCENCQEATNEFINERKDYFSDKNNFNIKEG